VAPAGEQAVAVVAALRVGGHADRVAMHILRHSRISVTMEIYTEATSEATRRPEEAR
jgi:hypothetical protein